ncbi:MAG: hypothetical protein KatS3mg087_1669 [Patescibacteria group bacterium]|nr:MAG: hypothetical protein CUN55_02960 [Phototrophicales bacterium]GIW60603.1 MAG: hypothetical protein KatS3mg087_1669 [Patescibacteria group bacterium]
MRKYLIIWSFVMIFALTGCMGGPKADADKIADRFPTEITIEEGDEQTVIWELDDSRTELSLEVQSNYGYITLEYNGDGITEDMTAYVTIIVYANQSAANVALQRELLDWQVQGVRFDTVRVRRNRYDLANFAGGQLAYLQDEATVFEVRIIADDPTAEIPEEAITSIFETIFQILEAS